MTRRSICLDAALAAALAIATPQVAMALADTTVEGSCGIANSGSASGNTINCNFGLTDAQLKQATKAAVEEATEELQDHIDKISERLAVTKGAARTLLKIVGEDANVPEDKLAEALTKVAGDYKRLQAQAAVLSPENPAARALVDEAKREIDAGHLDRARDLLRQATQAQIAAVRELKAVEDAQMLGAASSTATEGDVALTERHFKEAADLFGQAAGYVPSGHEKERGAYLQSQADALSRQGDEFGDNSALVASIDLWRGLLVLRPRERVPLDWATTQMKSLGIVLRRLASERAGRRGSKRRQRPFAQRWMQPRETWLRAFGQRFRIILAPRSRSWASVNPGQRSSSRRSWLFVRRWRK